MEQVVEIRIGQVVESRICNFYLVSIANLLFDYMVTLPADHKLNAAVIDVSLLNEPHSLIKSDIFLTDSF